MAILVEIHAAEGGDDARGLMRDQLGIYLRRCAKHRLPAELVDDRDSAVVLRVEGAQAWELFKDEAGGHRWQHVPPNEKRGRVHTSTVTVAVLPDTPERLFFIPECDLQWKAVRGSGAGGQAKNKTSNCVVLTHLPTRTVVRCESERSQVQNLATAKSLLHAKLGAKEKADLDASLSGQRKGQLGSGQRGDKRRTIRVQDGQVNDHVTGRRWRYRDYVRGDW